MPGAFLHLRCRSGLLCDCDSSNLQWDVGSTNKEAPVGMGGPTGASDDPEGAGRRLETRVA